MPLQYAIGHHRPIRWLFLVLWLATVPFASAQGLDEVRIGVLAKRGTEQALGMWTPTARYLSAHIPGHRFAIVPLGFDEIFPAVAQGKVDFVLANSSFYVELEVQYGVSRIATLRNDLNGHPYTEFGGVILTRADRSDIHTLEDLKGKRFMGAEESSFGGFQAAWLELQRAGIDPWREFKALTFGGTHDAVVYAVRDGKVDAGTVRTDTLERMAEEGRIDLRDYTIIQAKQHPDFPFLCSTALYPEWPFAKLRHTPVDLGHAVATALLAMPPDSEAARAGRNRGWTVPRNYQPVHELMGILHIGPYREVGGITLEAVLRAYGYWIAAVLAAMSALGGSTVFVSRLNRRLRRSEAELRDVREHLEQRVIERTAELEKTLVELAESRRRAELQRRDWNDAFDAISDPIFIHDRELRIVHANPAYAARAGLDAEALRGRLYWEVFPRLEGPLAACRQRPEQLKNAEEIRLDSGEVFVSRSFAIHHADGSHRHSIHVLEDMTAARRADAQRLTLSRALEQAGEGALVISRELEIEYSNSAASTLLGLIPDELCGSRFSDLFPAEALTGIAEIYIGAERDNGWSGEQELLARNGSRIPVYLTASTIRDEDYTPAGYVVTIMDLRPAKQAEAALCYRVEFEAIVGEIATRFVSVSHDAVDREIEAGLRQIGLFVGVDRAAVFIHAADEETLTNTHEWSAAGSEPPHDIRQTLPLADLPWLAPQLHRLEVVHIPDVGTLPAQAAAERGWLTAQGVQSLLLVPMVHTGALMGAISLERIANRLPWVDEDIRLVRTTGELIANALQHRAAELSVRESEARLSEAQRIAHLGNWVWDIGSGRLHWSDEIYRIFGLSPGQFEPSYGAFLERIPAEERGYVEEQVARALRREGEYSADHRVMRPDGEVRTVHEMGVVDFDETGSPIRMFGTVQDVTEARQAEQELRRLNRALRTLSRGNETLVRVGDETRLLAEVCRVLVETGGYRFAWVGYAEHDAQRTVRPVAHAGHEQGYLSAVAFSWGDQPSGQGPTGTAIRTGAAAIVRDITEPTFAPWREAAAARGYASCIALPLGEGCEVFGALTIDAGEPDAFDAQEVSLLTELANDLAFGIRTLRSRQERERAEKALAASEERLHRGLVQTIQAMAVTIEKRDPYTAGHQQRVAELAVAIARKLGLPEEQVEGLRLSAMIHDIGKIYVPAELLNRPGRLSDLEFRIIQSHPSVGYEIIRGIEFPWPVADIVVQHHERLDGSGYPNGLTGERILVEAKILAVADVVEAMATHRPYRAALPLQAALEEIEHHRGTRYDPQAVEACLTLFRAEGFSWPELEIDPGPPPLSRPPGESS